MRSPVSRREFLALSGGAIAGAGLTRATSRHDSPTDAIPHFDMPLPIPRVLQPIRMDATTDYYEIVQREERVEIVPGRHTLIWGYDGVFPGPTIKARRGRAVIVRHVNRLRTPTVVHLHGGVTPPESDGFPMEHVMPGEARAYVYPFSPAGVVEFFRDYYGPTNRAFAALTAQNQKALHEGLVALWSAQNQSSLANRTVVDSEIPADCGDPRTADALASVVTRGPYASEEEELYAYH